MTPPMPTDTQRAPTLRQCIDAEREAERLADLWRGTPHRHIGAEKVEAARAATDEAVGRVEDEVARLRQFVEHVIRAECWGQEVLDGGDIQERAVAEGILVQVTATAPCGEWCGCADVGADFPSTCYRFAWSANVTTTGGASDE